MCLLIVLFQARDDLPLVLGANRDELFERPATPMAVLRDASPRVIGGRDEVAGGTWLAVNERGVVAGLTNRPTTAGPDPTKRSRGELPLLLAAQESAAAAVEVFAQECRPAEFNPAWLIVADRDRAFAVDASGDGAATELQPGLHVLENRQLGASSSKVDHVRSRLYDVARLSSDQLDARLRTVLADHEIPAGPSAAEDVGRHDIPPAVGAACVHTERYGTRWSGLVCVPADRSSRPSFRYSAGPPCCTALQDASALFASKSRTRAR